MAITILRTRKDVKTDFSIVHFQCDTEADVADLPTNRRTGKRVCAAGSTAMVLNPDEGKSTCRRLTAEGEWVEAPQRIPGVPTVIDCGTPGTAH